MIDAELLRILKAWAIGTNSQHLLNMLNGTESPQKYLKILYENTNNRINELRAGLTTVEEQNKNRERAELVALPTDGYYVEIFKLEKEAERLSQAIKDGLK